MGKPIQSNAYQSVILSEYRLTLALGEGDPGDVIASPRAAVAVAQAAIGSAAQESVLAIMLDARHRVTGYAEIARGTLNAARLAPRDVFVPVMLTNAAAVIIAHNHPSGETAPSRGDRTVTRAIVNAGALLGVPVLDHVIITARGEFYSFRDAGEIGDTAADRVAAFADGDAPAYAAEDLADVERRLASAEDALAALDSMREIRTAQLTAFGGETMGRTAVDGYSPAHVFGLDPDSESDVKVARERVAALRAEHAAAERDVRALRAERRTIVAGIAAQTGRAPVGWTRVAGTHEFEPLHTFRATVPAVAEPVAAVPSIAERANAAPWMRAAEPVAPVWDLPPIEAYADVDAAPVCEPVRAVAAVRVFRAAAPVAEPVRAAGRAPLPAFVLAPRRPGGRRLWRAAVTVARCYWRAVAAAVRWAESEPGAFAEPVGATFRHVGGLALADGDAPGYGVQDSERERFTRLAVRRAERIRADESRVARIVDAAHALADLDSAVWFDQATAFSCTEADTLAELFRAVGCDGLADQFIAEHGRGDTVEDGDSAEHIDAATAAYRETHGDAAISNGSTWAESEVTAEPVAEPEPVAACKVRRYYRPFPPAWIAECDCGWTSAAATSDGLAEAIAEHVTPQGATFAAVESALAPVWETSTEHGGLQGALPFGRAEQGALFDGDAPRYMGAPSTRIDRLADGLAVAAAHAFAWSLVLESAYPHDPAVAGDVDARAALAIYWNVRDGLAFGALGSFGTDAAALGDGDAPSYEPPWPFRGDAIRDAFYRGVPDLSTFDPADVADVARSIAWRAVCDVTDCHTATLVLDEIRSGACREVMVACGLADGDRPRYVADPDAPKVDHVAEAITRLDAGIAELSTSEGWARWLRTQSRFHRYSWGNVFLIAAQTGGAATRVAGFHTWKALGRSVRKGEKAIWILAPIARKIRTEDEETGEETTRRVVTGFRGAAVFDVAQTDGEPLAEPVTKLDGDAPAELWDRLESVARAHRYTVYQYTPTNGANGFTDPAGSRIVVDQKMAPAMRCKTLAHELGHMLLHAEHGCAGTCRDVAELEAESVAFCVLSKAGIDAGGYSFGYVLHWQGGSKEASDTLRKSAERIAAAAREIIGRVWPEAAEPAGELVAADGDAASYRSQSTTGVDPKHRNSWGSSWRSVDSCSSSLRRSDACSGQIARATRGRAIAAMEGRIPMRLQRPRYIRTRIPNTNALDVRADIKRGEPTPLLRRPPQQRGQAGEGTCPAPRLEPRSRPGTGSSTPALAARHTSGGDQHGGRVPLERSPRRGALLAERQQTRSADRWRPSRSRTLVRPTAAGLQTIVSNQGTSEAKLQEWACPVRGSAPAAAMWGYPVMELTRQGGWHFGRRRLLLTGLAGGLIMSGCGLAGGNAGTTSPPSSPAPLFKPPQATTTATTMTPDPCAQPGTIPDWCSQRPGNPPVDEIGWVTTLPDGFAPVMPAATAELAIQLTPSLSSLHLSPVVPTVYWSESECDWLSDTMYADIQLDGAAASRDYASLDIPLGFWYSNVTDEWRFLEGIATQACWRGGVITGAQAAEAIKDAMGDGWNGHPAHLALDAPGSFDETWDYQWADAYQEIATLFAQVPQSPYYFCMDSGWGQAFASTCTAATVLASLGVKGT